MRTITDKQLLPYSDNNDNGLNSRLRAFIRQQRATWPVLETAHRQLEGILHRTLRLPDSAVELQCNPGRTRSTTAKVSGQEVARRPCFLCPANLYPEQLALPLSPGWVVLNNPFPIFNDHLVISSVQHSEQLLAPALPAMVQFVTELKGSFSAFYNGPRCGASAPDHLHFQACPARLLPLERDLHTMLDEGRHEEASWILRTLDNRGTGLCRAMSAKALLENLHAMYTRLNRTAAQGQEADLNLIIFGHRGTLAAAFLPRRAHRPACFFASGDDQILISPGAVDVGGLVILPRQEDLEKMTEEKILSIYREVCLPADVMEGNGSVA